jgi:hypothetical protein
MVSIIGQGWLSKVAEYLLSEVYGAFGRVDSYPNRQLVLPILPATLRTQIFLCGAILGKSGRKQVLHLSSTWGGLETRNSLFEKILSYVFPTSPKLDLVLQNVCP